MIAINNPADPSSTQRYAARLANEPGHGQERIECVWMNFMDHFSHNRNLYEAMVAADVAERLRKSRTVETKRR